MKLCIIGDSHLGALKRAWDGEIELNLKKDVEITFFAQRGAGLNDLKLDGQSLVATNESLKKALVFTSNGKSSIDLPAYDAFLIYGVRLKAYFANNNFYSVEVLDKAISDNYENTLGYKLLRMIRSKVDNRIYLGHNPLAANPNRDKIENISDRYSRGVALVNDRFFSKMNTTLVSQPQATLVGDNWNTNSKYAKGSKRLDIGDNIDSQLHSDSDIAHMNDEFGKLWLEAFLKIL